VWGSIAVEQHIYQRISAHPVVQELAGGRVHIPYVPEPTDLADVQYPYVVGYRTDARDETPQGPEADVLAERLLYTVAVVGEGFDKRALLRLAKAVHESLQGQSDTIAIDDDNGDPFATYFIVGERVGELPNDEIVTPDDGVDHVALGGAYEYDVTALEG
jgi:hypothetical protein